MPTNIQNITVSDLQHFSYQQIILIRNEIYARHGGNFKDPYLHAYFELQDWYMLIADQYASTCPVPTPAPPPAPMPKPLTDALICIDPVRGVTPDTDICIHDDGSNASSVYGVFVLVPAGKLLGKPSIKDESTCLGN